MSKVLYVVPGGQDLGGIITASENYMAGFEEAGHSATFVTLTFGPATPGRTAPRGKFANDFVVGYGTGELMHTTQGWRGERRISLGTPAGIAEFIALSKQHDVTVWASLYGLRNENTEGKTAWVEAIRKARRNVFMIHDDHIKDRYPWAFALSRYAAAFIGVQPCSYDSLAGAAAPRAMVYTTLAPLPRSTPQLAERKYQIASIQVWKQWKRADVLVRAAPHLKRLKCVFAGDGIALRYMRSLDKCPERFWDGDKRIWDVAMAKRGVSYVGVLGEVERDVLLRESMFLVDMSLRHNSGQLNRIVQEAMAQGCVIIANPAFISGTRSNPLFKPDVDYLPIDTLTNPRDIARTLEDYGKISLADYARLAKSARAKLKLFNRANGANAIVRAGLGEPVCEALLDYQDKHRDEEAMRAGLRAFREVFGATP